MKPFYVLLVPALLSACASTGGAPNHGLFGYPRVDPTAVDAMATQSIDLPATTLEESTLATASVPAVAPARPAAAPSVAEAPQVITPAMSERLPASETAAYDEKNDPYVMAVLKHAPADEAKIESGPNGDRVMLPPPARLEVVDLSENHAALEAANP